MGVAAVRADFDALRQHLGLDKVHALGWSNGAMNLILLAGEKPEILESAIFLHGAANYTEEDGKAMAEKHPELIKVYGEFQGVLASDEVGNSEKEAGLRDLYLDGWFPLMFAEEDAGRAWLEEAYAGVELSWRHARYSDVEQPSFDSRDLLPNIPVRSLVVFGAHDMMPVSKGEEMHAGLPDSELVLFEQSGHFAPVEEPEKFVSTVLDFLGIAM